LVRAEGYRLPRIQHNRAHRTDLILHTPGGMLPPYQPKRSQRCAVPHSAPYASNTRGPDAETTSSRPLRVSRRTGFAPVTEYPFRSWADRKVGPSSLSGPLDEVRRQHALLAPALCAAVHPRRPRTPRSGALAVAGVRQQPRD
jgi:hypothetical protein